MSNLKKLWKHLDNRRKIQSILILLLILIASLFEVISVASIIPFLGALTSPDILYQHHLMSPLIEFFDLSEPNQLILPLTIIFISAVTLAGIIRLTLLFVMTRFSFATGADISIDIYNRTLYQNYSTHINRNSSEIINGIITKTNIVIGGVVSPVLTLISSSVMLVSITSALFIIDAKVALISSIGFGLIYLVVIFFTRKILRDNSKRIAEESTTMIKSLQEGLGGIRDVLISGTQQFYSDLYIKSNLPHRIASGNNEFIGGSPRFIVEAIGMSLIALLAYSLTNREAGIVSALPILGALALGAQRLLPAIQQGYASYTTLQATKSSFEDVLALLEQPLPSFAGQPPEEPMSFKKDIELKKLSFNYSHSSPWIFKTINLKIKKGSRVGFIGQTGCGKSTLIDIIMGLFDPVEGEMFIDGKLINNSNIRSWQSNIAHVPQHVYLSDSSITDNIAFGIPKNEINNEKIKLAAKKAQISEMIENWKDGYQTFVGEQGIKLSGGQRQRIGIARALYRDANVLIFDEATSALDTETEKAVMESIDSLGLDLTILIIAHRLTTLKQCDYIVEVFDKSKLVIKKPMEIIKNEKNEIF
jgi:ATP-binding cassette, subfamily B, bacterial PglK